MRAKATPWSFSMRERKATPWYLGKGTPWYLIPLTIAPSVAV